MGSSIAAQQAVGTKKLDVLVRPLQENDLEAADRVMRLAFGTAAEDGLSQVTAGVNTARHEAYRQMYEHGFRTEFHGVVMQRPNEPGYNRPGTYIIDDWR